MLYYPRKVYLWVNSYYILIHSFLFKSLHLCLLCIQHTTIFGTECLKRFFFLLFLQSFPLFPVSRKSILQDFCWRWKKSIPELRGSKYSVTQLLGITQHTCWKILAIHSLLNSSHHLCEAKQRIRKFHTDKIISTTHIHVVFFFFFWTAFLFSIHSLLSPLQSPTYSSFCVHAQAFWHKRHLPFLTRTAAHK